MKVEKTPLAETAVLDGHYVAELEQTIRLLKAERAGLKNSYYLRKNYEANLAARTAKYDANLKKIDEYLVKAAKAIEDQRVEMGWCVKALRRNKAKDNA